MNIKTKLESVLNVRKKKHVLKDEPKREKAYCMPELSALCGSICGGSKLRDHEEKFCQDDVSGRGYRDINYTDIFNGVACLSYSIRINVASCSFQFSY